MDGINNQKRNYTANRPHQLLVSEAASALTHLASGRRGGEADCAPDTTTNSTIDIHAEVQSSEESSTTAATKGDAPYSSSPHHQEGESHGGANDDESFNRKKPPPSKAEIIKETVISRLHRPEDMVKRNMFAVEGKSIRFPVKLMFILDECKEFEHIISWSDEGTAFILHDAAAFEDKVLPEIFKEARFSSFLRKLTRWGFLKKSTPFGMKFYQKKFRRGNYSMCVDITCSNNATDVRRAQNRERKNATSPTMNGRSNMIVLKNGFATSTTSSNTANSKRKSSDGVQNMAGGNPAARLTGMSTHGTTASSRNDELLLQETNSPILQSSIASSLCNNIISKNNIIERQRQLLQLQIEEQEKQERKFQELLSSSASLSSFRSHSNSELNSLQNNLIRYQGIQKAIKEMLRDDRATGQEVIGNRFTQEQDTSLTLLNSLTNQGLGTGTQVPNGTLAGPSGLFLPHRLQDGCRIHSQVMSAALEGLLSSEQQNDPVSPQSLLLGVPAPPVASEDIQNAIQQELQPRGLLSTNAFSSSATSATTVDHNNSQNDFVLLRKEINNAIRDLSIPSDLGGRPSVNSLLNLPQGNTPRVNDFNILLEMARKVRNHGS